MTHDRVTEKLLELGLSAVHGARLLTASLRQKNLSNTSDVEESLSREAVERL